MDANFYGYGGPYPQYNPVPGNDPKSFTQTLTVEQANALRQHIEEFTLTLTEKERWIAICMHREPANGQSTLVRDANDPTRVRCMICGEDFRFRDKLSEDDVAAATNNLMDILQSIKAMYLDMPNDAAANFYIILALLKKLPGLYKIAVGNFAQHERAYNPDYLRGPGIVSAWQQVNGYGGFGWNNPFGQAAPMYNPGMPQPNMGMGMPQPMYGAPVAPGGNPFFSNPQGAAPAPQPTAYQPQMMGYQYTPTQATQAVTLAQPLQQAAPAAQPAAPAAPGTVAPAATTATTDGSTVAVNQTFTA